MHLFEITFILTEKEENILGLVALIGAIIGSMLIALNIGFNVVGYIFFAFSSISSVLLLVSSKSPKSLVWVNLWFSLMNIVGIIRYA